MPQLREPRAVKVAEATLAQTRRDIKGKEWLLTLSTRYMGRSKGLGLITALSIDERAFILPYEGIQRTKEAALIVEQVLEQSGNDASYILWIKVVSVTYICKFSLCKNLPDII